MLDKLKLLEIRRTQPYQKLCDRIAKKELNK
jgi:hypothetical protein